MSWKQNCNSSAASVGFRVLTPLPVLIICFNSGLQKHPKLYVSKDERLSCLSRALSSIQKHADVGCIPDSLGSDCLAIMHVYCFQGGLDTPGNIEERQAALDEVKSSGTQLTEICVGLNEAPLAQIH